MNRKICIVTGTRAEWGLLSGIAKALKNRSDVTLQVIATNMHLDERFGNTYKDIEADGINIDYKVPMPIKSDSPNGIVSAMGECMRGMANAFDILRPELLIILGDRYEMLATASAALIYKIPIAHLHGGEVSLGAFDESIRHSITKMSHLHFTATEESRQRVIQLGENPEHVFNTGAIGVYNIKHASYMSKDELESSLHTSIPEKSILITFHPSTLDSVSPRVQCENLLAALDDHDDYKVIFTYPNNDTNGRIIIELIEDYAMRHAERCVVYPSLGLRRYLSALQYVAAVAGNSSSGILEVPSMGIPTLNIGIRQEGRQRADSVIDCGVTKEEISKGLDLALSDAARKKARKTKNPYEKPDTLDFIVNTVVTFPLDDIICKPFFDLKK